MKRTTTLVGMALGALALTIACNDQSTTAPDSAGPGDVSLLLAPNATSGNPFIQCGNKGPTCTWETGNINPQKALMHEGDVVPFRITVNQDVAKTNRLYEIRLKYSTRVGGKNAYDFVTRYNASEGAKANLCNPSGNLTPNNLSNVSNYCSASGGVIQAGEPAQPPLDIPIGFAGGSAGTDPKSDEIAASTHSIDRIIQVFGGTLGTGVTDPTITYVASQSGATEDAILTFRFRTKSGTGAANFIVAWGGHISQTTIWASQGGGAAGISGSSYHMSLEYMNELNDNGSVFKTLTTGSRDLQLSASAVVAQPALGIAKTPTSQTKSAGESFSWTVTLTNSGTGTASGATISDPLPVVTGVSYAVGAGSDASCVITNNTLNCGPKDLAAGGTLVAVIDATTSAGTSCAENGFTNTATGAATGVTSVTATATVILNCPSLSITKTPDQAGDAGYTVEAPGTATFTVTVANTGAGSAFNTLLTDTLPADLTWAESPDKTECAIGSITVNAVSRQRLVCTIGTLAAGGSFTVSVSATVPLSFLQQPPSAAGDPIEIDGNLVDSPAGGAKDWATVGISCTGTITGCDIDLPTGATDNSFGGGTSEDDAVPKVVTGSIPNNKSDLLRFYVANERFVSTDYLYLAWERVQAPNGTTNMDFELNQSTTLSSNGVTPVRTAGDILVKFDLSQGGTTPTLGFHKWVTTGSNSQCNASGGKVPCWGALTELTTNVAAAINTGSVTDPINPGAPRTLDALTFGEARIDLQASGFFQAGVCTNFGRAYLKSRSSDSFTSEIKDFIAPIPISVSNCQPRLIDNKAYVQADGISPISDTGQINVTESASTLLFTTPESTRLAQADVQGAVPTGVVTATVAFEGNDGRELRRAGVVLASVAERASGGDSGLLPPLLGMGGGVGPVAT